MGCPRRLVLALVPCDGRVDDGGGSLERCLSTRHAIARHDCLYGLQTCFLLFLLFASSPFERSLPFYPSEGADLNPLLQDFGLIVHPPLLYMGYVGLSVPFAFAIASLWSGAIDLSWTKWSRPWTNVAWAFLTAGITLGSWWAYYELGWGGWWFWDAVENASFMPWLLATALVHSLAATEKRGVFKSWTLLLAIGGFSFSLLGAFLVRSGVLTSVHAFAVDPERGLAILAFLVPTIGGSLLLYALRARHIKTSAAFALSSRESFILGNNVLLAVSTLMILLGTIYPLIYEAATGGLKISVGPPYFNTLFLPLMGLLLVLLMVGHETRWRETNLECAIPRTTLAMGSGDGDDAKRTFLAGFTLLSAGAVCVFGSQHCDWVDATTR